MSIWSLILGLIIGIGIFIIIKSLMELNNRKIKSNNFYKHWAKRRTEGKWFFITVRGGILWGGSLLISINVLHLFIYGLDYIYLVISFIVWPIGGLLFASIIWKLNEKKYHKKVIS